MKPMMKRIDVSTEARTSALSTMRPHVIVVALGALVAIVLFGIISVRRQRAELHAAGDRLARALAAAVAEPLWTLSDEGMRRAVAAMENLREIERAVVSENGRITATYDSEGVRIFFSSGGNPIARPSWIADRRLAQFVYRAPIYWQDRTIGHATVLLNRSSIEDAVGRAIVGSVLLYVGQLVLIVGLLAVLMEIMNGVDRRGNRVRLMRELRSLQLDQSRLRYQAYYDYATGLPLLRALNEEVPVPAAESKAHPRHSRFMIALSVEHVAELVSLLDTHLIDELLRVLAARARTNLGSSCAVLVRGYGFKFFAVAQLDGLTAARARAARLIEVMERPIHLRTGAFRIRVRAAVASFPIDMEVNEARKRADAGLRATVRMPHGSAVAEYDDAARHEHSLRTALEQAMSGTDYRSQLSAHYQAIVDLRVRRVVGYELLVRWSHPELGMIPPSVFIPIAEENGEILNLGWWAVRQAADAITRIDAARTDGGVFVNVNLSPVQLLSERLVDDIRALIAERPELPRRLRFELTETSVGNDSTAYVAAVRALQELGFLIVIDDFGAGSSTLRRLNDYRFGMIKIDRHFVSGAADNWASKHVLKSIAGLARALRIPALAEGIESREHVQLVLEAGFELGQGYHLHRPDTLDRCLDALARDQTVGCP